MSNAKNVLKSLVKECLLELLHEGIGLKENSSKKSIHPPEPRPKNNSNHHSQKIVSEVKKPSKNMESIISSIADNDLMKNILADTANTTLIEQMNHERANQNFNSPSQPNPHEGAGVDLDSMFSDSKNNWSVMAFGKAKNK